MTICVGFHKERKNTVVCLLFGIHCGITTGHQWKWRTEWGTRMNLCGVIIGLMLTEYVDVTSTELSMWKTDETNFTGNAQFGLLLQTMAKQSTMINLLKCKIVLNCFIFNSQVQSIIPSTKRKKCILVYNSILCAHWIQSFTQIAPYSTAAKLSSSICALAFAMCECTVNIVRKDLFRGTNSDSIEFIVCTHDQF